MKTSFLAKLLATSSALLLLSVMSLGTMPKVSADDDENNDECNEVFTYTKSSDFNDSRVDINFENSDNQIDVSAQSGYQITEVSLEVHDDGHSGFYVYATGPVDNFNPNPGTNIEVAKVKVKKVCAEPTATPTPTPTPIVGCEVDCVTPTITPVPTMFFPNTGSPNGDGKSDGRSDGKSDGRGGSILGASTGGQVLGASTYAATGTSADMIMNFVGVLGAISTGLGAMIAKKFNK